MKTQSLLNAFQNFAIICTDINGKITETNKQANTLLATKQLVGLDFITLFKIDNKLNIQKNDAFKDILALTLSQTTFNCLPYVHPTKGDTCFDVKANEVTNDNNEVEGFLFIINTINETYNFYKFTAHLFSDVICILDANEKHVFVSSSIEKVLGYTQEDILNVSFLSLIHAQYKEEFDMCFKNATAQKKEKWKHTSQFKHKSGEWIWAEILINHFYDNQHNLVKTIVILKDITERKEYEKTIQEHQSFVESIACTLPHIIFVYDLKLQKILYLNDAIERLMGYDLEAVLSQKGIFLKDIVDDSFSSSLASHYIQLKQVEKNDNRVFQNDLRLRHKDGKIYWYLVSETILQFDKNDESEQVLGIIQNIHEVKTANQNLKNQKELLDKILDNLPIGIFIKDEEGKYQFMNQEVLDLNNFKREKILQKNDKELFESREALKNINTDNITRDKKIHSWVEKFNNKHKLIGKKLIRLNQRNEDAILGYSIDISEQKNAEKEIIENRSFIKAFTQTIPDELFIFDFHSLKFLYSNHTIWESIGYEINEIENLTKEAFLAIIHPEDRESIINHGIFLAKANEKIYELTTRVKHKNGSYHHLYSRVIPYTFDEKGVLKTVIGVIQDVTAQSLLIEALQETKNRQELAAEAGNVGIWDWNIIEDKIHLDIRLSDMLGFYSQEIGNTSKEWVNIIHPEDKEFTTQIVRECLTNKNYKYDIEHRFICKSGETKWFLSQGKVFWDNNKPVRMIGTCTDINRLKETENYLIRAKIEAEQAAQAKSNFLSTMSHEIRTPMNAVIGMTNLLLQKNPNPEQIQYLDTLKFSAENLLVLINDILDFTKIEEGKVVFENIIFNLKDLLNNLEKSHVEKAKEKRIQLIFLVASNLPELIVGDPVRISQILNNLISNAIKFTEKGQVKVEVFLEDETKNNANIFFAVTDTGIGIAPEKQAKVFESFTQASSDTTRKFGGTGLGLAISKKLIELQHGKIFLESELNKGSKFHFTIQFKKPHKNTTLKNSLIEEQSTTQNKREGQLTNIKTLLVEDNKVNQFLATEFLNMWGMSIDYALNGQEAVDKVKENKYDLVLMDLQMPIMDGYTASKEIRKLDNGKMADLPIIALTAEVMQETREKIQESLMNDYISKPFKPEELFEKIKKYITANKSLEENVDFKVSNSLLTISHQDQDTAKELAGLMTDLFEEVIEKFTQAMKNRNLEDLRFIIHKAKSSIKLLGLDNLDIKSEEAKTLIQQNAKDETIEKAIAEYQKLCKQVLKELYAI